MQELNKRDNWWISYIFSSNLKVKELFFAKNTLLDLIKMYSEVFLINTIYKINRYKQLLCIIIDVTSINTTVYVAFCFLSDKKKDTNK